LASIESLTCQKGVPVEGPVRHDVFDAKRQRLSKSQVFSKPILVNRLAAPIEQVTVTTSVAPIIPYDWMVLAFDDGFELSNEVHDLPTIRDDANTKQICWIV